MPGVTVDVYKVLEVYREATKAIERVRSGKGPTFFECMWHWWTGHSISDADVYRTNSEKAEGENRCPVVTFRDVLIGHKIITKRTYDDMKRKAKKKIEEAVEYRERECTDPEPADVLVGVYSDE